MTVPFGPANGLERVLVVVARDIRHPGFPGVPLVVMVMTRLIVAAEAVIRPVDVAAWFSHHSGGDKEVRFCLLAARRQGRFFCPRLPRQGGVWDVRRREGVDGHNAIIRIVMPLDKGGSTSRREGVDGFNAIVCMVVPFGESCRASQCKGVDGLDTIILILSLLQTC